MTLRLAPRPDDRPILFLVSTTSAARDMRNGLGAPAYSYSFVVDALAPVLERLGTWRRVDRPESRLPFLAARARAEGFFPVHLAVNPLQDCYFSPALPNLVMPFWEFPEIPDRDFDGWPRENWARVLRGASGVIASCEFTARAFRCQGLPSPVRVVPVPIAPAAFALADWEPGRVHYLECRHEIWGQADAPNPLPAVAPTEISPGGRGGVTRAIFRRVAPHLRPETVERLASVRGGIRSLRGRPFRLSVVLGVRAAYRRTIRPLLGDATVAKVTSFKEALLRRLGRDVDVSLDPLLPSSRLTLGGLVYLTVLTIGDPRKNWHDLLSAFLVAFRDRPDVTLVLKVVTNPRAEFHEVGLLRERYRAMGIAHRCRVVVIPEFLDDARMDALFASATYYVNTSHAEGACLPLMRALAGGRPAIAPDHTAMGDYVDASQAFVPRSDVEPTHWPHDPEKRMTTTRYRLVWSDIRDAFIESARTAESDPVRYRAMARAARDRMQAYAGREAATSALYIALSDILTDLAYKESSAIAS